MRNVADHAPLPTTDMCQRTNLASPGTDTALTVLSTIGVDDGASVTGGAASANVDSSRNGDDSILRTIAPGLRSRDVETLDDDRGAGCAVHVEPLARVLEHVGDGCRVSANGENVGEEIATTGHHAHP